TPPDVKVDRISGFAAIHYDALLVEIKLLFEKADALGCAKLFMGRRIVEARRRAEHRDLYLPPKARGHGVARELHRRAVRLYEELGVVEVIVAESERIGRYANARLGYDFLETGNREAVLEAV